MNEESNSIDPKTFLRMATAKREDKGDDRSSTRQIMQLSLRPKNGLYDQSKHDTVG